MTAKTVAANSGSYRRRQRVTPTEGGSRTAQSALMEIAVTAVPVVTAVPQALTDDDSAGQG